MTHIWQRLRSGDWLTAARVRGYSLILLALGAIAVVGWIAQNYGAPWGLILGGAVCVLAGVGLMVLVTLLVITLVRGLARPRG